MESIFNGLLEFSSKTELNDFVNNIDIENSIKLIETALESAHGNGVFSMEETHIIYTCLLKLKKSIYETDNLSNNNIDGGVVS